MRSQTKITFSQCDKPLTSGNVCRDSLGVMTSLEIIFFLQINNLFSITVLNKIQGGNISHFLSKKCLRTKRQSVCKATYLLSIVNVRRFIAWPKLVED